MNYLRNSLLAATALLVTTSAGSLPAQAEDGVKVGVLECFVEGGAGFVIGSIKDVSCTYRSVDGSAEENYFGTISKFGLDVGVTGEAIMQWAVVAPSKDIYEPGALAGDYGGASASASFAVGLGANVLVGGSQDSFALQPISVQAQTGVNLALGVAKLELRSIQ